MSRAALARRMAERIVTGPQLAAGYIGADSSRRALSSWGAGLGSADQDTLLDLPALRARSRDLIRNAPLASGAINTNVTSTIGTGLKLQPRINRRRLGLTQEQADEWEREAQELFLAVCDQLDITRTQTFTGLQDLACRSPLESGDLFTLRRYQRNAGDVLGLKVQLIEADRVCNPYGSMDSDRLRSGVALDGNGAPTGYHVASRHPWDFLYAGPIDWTYLPAFGPSGERQVLHHFKRRRPHQTRGVPYLAPAIEPFKQLDRYGEAELMAAVINALFTVFIKSDGEGDGDTENSMLAPHPQQLGEGDTVESTAAAGDLKMGSGSIVGLAPGDSVEMANPGRPNPNYDPFVQAVLRQVGVSLELPFEVLIKHFTASYSAARAALLEAWRYFMVCRLFTASSFCQPIYEWVITEAVARGQLVAPGFFTDPLARRAWLGRADQQWVGDAMGQLNPKDEAEASVTLINAKLSNREIEAAKIHGQDWESVMEQAAQEEATAERLGLDLTPANAPSPPAQPGSSGDKPDSEDA